MGVKFQPPDLFFVVKDHTFHTLGGFRHIYIYYVYIYVYISIYIYTYRCVYIYICRFLYVSQGSLLLLGDFFSPVSSLRFAMF